jgi:hypothetical protein
MGVPAFECLPSSACKEQSGPWQRAPKIRQMVPQVSSRVACDKNPNLKDVTNILEKYFAGFQRLAEMEIGDELRKDVYLVSCPKTACSTSRGN